MRVKRVATLSKPGLKFVLYFSDCYYLTTIYASDRAANTERAITIGEAMLWYGKSTTRDMKFHPTNPTAE